MRSPWFEIILEDMLQRGEEEVFEPWPIADLPLSSPSIWSRYSDQRLLDRITEIYSAALQIYEAMVVSWFGSFTGLRLSSLLPVRIEGTLTIHDERYDIPIPSLSWYPMILPTGNASSIAFELGSTNASWHDTDFYFENQGSAFARLRGGDPERAPLFYVGFSLLEVSSSRPATELAHKWLVEDLQHLGWLGPLARQHRDARSLAHKVLARTWVSGSARNESPRHLQDFGGTDLRVR